jgi:hypothetical protein
MFLADSPQTSRLAVTQKPRRIRTAACWVTTSVAALAFAALGTANLAHAAPIMNGLAHLGYPPYFAMILGTWELLAAIALVVPGLERVRGWAYAGMFFTLTGAALSHAFSHDGAPTVIAPLVLLGLVMASWRLGQRTRPRSHIVSSEPSGVADHVGH